MPVIDSIASANAAMTDAYYELRSAGVRQAVADRMREIISSPVPPEAISGVVEFAYANKAEIHQSILDELALICDYASAMLWYGLGQDGRGTKIGQALRGETPDDPPTPEARFVVPPDPETPGEGENETQPTP